MKSTKITYWICTGLFCAMMTLAGCLYLAGSPQALAIFAHLGYPPYFPSLLGTAKLLGVVVLLIPGARLLKEWAYAGFTITCISAFVSHLASNDGPKALPALVALGLLVVSYFTRPADRAVPAAHPNVPTRDMGLMPPPRPAHG
ncbi:MAG TPA: DoxX family protein [Verrucomicrobiae bacterium]|jgi:hypothetical protein|nr:DoxX family protein [Verrucomicrobiae bacterium]